MPPINLRADLDSSTAVPSTPTDRSVATPVEGGSSIETHFNASLDRALNILKRQDVLRQHEPERSATPMSWSSSTATLAGKSTSYGEGAFDTARKTPDDIITSYHASTIEESLQMTKNKYKEDADTASQASEKDVAVECQARARIPYPGGHFYLHLYHTDEDDKEHLAIVFGDDIRSESLERARDGETDMGRKIRGASIGALRRMVAQDIKHRNQPGSDNDNTGFFEPDQADMFAASRVSIVDAPLVRIHSECFTGETVSSVRCDCGYQLAEAMREIQQEGRGVIVYLRQEGRGIGLLEKLKAYNLQDMGHDTVDANLLLNHPADARTYGSARSILADLGISKLRLLTNNTDKIRQLCGRSSQLDIVCHVPMYPRWWSDDVHQGAPVDQHAHGGDGISQLSYARHLNLKKGVMAEADRYLRTKAERMGHMLPLNASLALPGIVKPHVSATSALYLNN